MILGLLFLRRERRPHHPWKLYTAALAIMAILAFIDGPWISVLFIPLAVLIYELALGGSILARLFGSKSLLLLGGASYAIYLLQLPIRNWLHLFLVGAANDKGGIDAIVSPVVLVIFSIGVFLFWEEPARKWLRNRFKKLEAMRYAKPS
jgi:peptidoglycan/LPS O-acetylase OafA/YrhL